MVPEEDLLSELPRGRLQIADLMVLKMRFGVSMQTILLAAYRAGSVTQGERDRLFRVFSSRGWRLNEPGEVPVEQPVILREALRIHREEHGYSDQELAAVARVTLDTLAGLLPEYFERSRPTLRVVSQAGSSRAPSVDAMPAEPA
jgi:Zn-dependent peptidase ImmA (M78 family)